jgi:redox-sensitive bicupin YhaK (pirin superfamily)
MLTHRRSDDRFHTRIGWLDSRHTFSFGEHHDEQHMGFRALRVINEDRVAPGQGFGTHGHRDMEIISYVLEGQLAHRDSMGTGSVIVPGDVQRMSAGTGVMHSEENPSRVETVHFLQIWILPEARRLPPSYEQKHFSDEQRRNRLCPVATRDGRDGSLRVHQDVTLYASLLDPGTSLTHELAAGRHAWIQVARGALAVNGERLDEGDGAAISDEARIAIAASAASELLLFDLA